MSKKQVTPRPLPDVFDGRHFRAMSDGVVSAFEAYTPTADVPAWEALRPFVLDVVALSQPPAGQEQRVLRVVAPFVLWCVTEQGLPTEVTVLFRSTVMDAYCREVSPNPRTQATYRSVLLRVADSLVPEGQAAPVTAIPRVGIQPPYTRDELQQFRGWAAGQNTRTKVRRARLLLSLGAGAGLTVSEIAVLRCADILTDDVGIVLTVRRSGSPVRSVPMLREWEGMLREAIKPLPANAWLWTPTAATTGKNAFNQFAASTIGAAPAPARLRTTWLTTHLRLGTPMPALFAAAGFKRWDNLHQYLTFIEPTPETDYRALLRGRNA